MLGTDPVPAPSPSTRWRRTACATGVGVAVLGAFALPAAAVAAPASSGTPVVDLSPASDEYGFELGDLGDTFTAPDVPSDGAVRIELPDGVTLMPGGLSAHLSVFDEETGEDVERWWAGETPGFDVEYVDGTLAEPVPTASTTTVTVPPTASPSPSTVTLEAATSEPVATAPVAVADEDLPAAEPYVAIQLPMDELKETDTVLLTVTGFLVDAVDGEDPFNAYYELDANPGSAADEPLVLTPGLIAGSWQETDVVVAPGDDVEVRLPATSSLRALGLDALTEDGFVAVPADLFAVMGGEEDLTEMSGLVHAAERGGASAVAERLAAADEAADEDPADEEDWEGWEDPTIDVDAAGDRATVTFPADAPEGTWDLLFFDLTDDGTVVVADATVEVVAPEPAAEAPSTPAPTATVTAPATNPGLRSNTGWDEAAVQGQAGSPVSPLRVLLGAVLLTVAGATGVRLRGAVRRARG